MARKLFPGEFSDLLSAKGKRILKGGDVTLCSSFAGSKNYFVSVHDAIDEGQAQDCMQLLDDRLYPHLQRIGSKIPPDSISTMTVNYSETLPKTMRMKTAYLDSSRALSYKAAEEIGLIKMMGSKSLLDFAQSITGLELDPDVGYQVICYEHGDYVGPHNDHHPESDSTKNGFVDLHITLANSSVDHQWIVYEERGHFSRIVDATRFGSITAYRLPFWHYVTPLAGKPGREAQARRWLLLGTFNFLE
jgi:hypothetical protein